MVRDKIREMLILGVSLRSFIHGTECRCKMFIILAQSLVIHITGTGVSIVTFFNLN